MMKLIILNRLGSCPGFDSFIYQDFPAYPSVSPAQDTHLIEEICQKYGAHLFISTAHTTPISTPSLLILHEPDSTSSASGWQFEVEKELAICHANGFIVTSEQAAQSLAQYADIPNTAILNISQLSEEQLALALYKAICKLSDARFLCRQPHITQQWLQYRKVAKELHA